jgi:hypothetical protein
VSWRKRATHSCTSPSTSYLSAALNSSITCMQTPRCKHHEEHCRLSMTSSCMAATALVRDGPASTLPSACFIHGRTQSKQPVCLWSPL